VRSAYRVGLAFLLTVPSSGFPFSRKWRTDAFEIYTSAPPAALLVIRGDGKRAGADPARPMSSVGVGTVLNEFPLADVEQVNTATDEADGTRTPGPSTLWNVTVMDESPAVYQVQLRGLAEGLGELGIALAIRPRTSTSYEPHLKMETFLAAGAVREFIVSSDRTARAVRISRVVKENDLSQSVTIGCGMGLIESEGVCQSLKSKASSVARSLKRGNRHAAAGEIEAFLHELDSQAGKHVREPALTILREEAEALLNPPPPMASTGRRGAGTTAQPAK